MNAAFWKDRSVFLTGHTGFKGSWLSIWLSSLGARVTGYALEPETDPNLFESAGVADTIQSIIGDVRDLEQLSAVLRAERFDVVIHMAAQSLVRVSYREPVDTYSTNVMGTVNILEAVRQSGQKPAVVVVTSDKCYANRNVPAGYREDDSMGGFDPYSSSKGCAELVCAAYRNAFLKDGGIPMASARSGNVIGGGDWAEDRLLPDCVRAYTTGETVSIRYPQATRPWQHVLEPLGGYLLLAEKLVEEGDRFAGPWNFGPQESDVRTVREVASRFAELWGPPAGVEMDTAAHHPHEAQQLLLNCDKAREQLGWKPRIELDEALAWTVQWYTATAGDQNQSRSACLEQIRAFTDMKRK